ncbi:MAG: class I SAM-dependent methyltransferase [Rhizonema sp. PD38]|nr:class I SAM-dependent methyltransferase [Rhizonema sp. PD38]
MNDDKLLQKDYQVKGSSYFYAERFDMLSYVPQSSSMILEVGCGYGNFGKLLKEKYSAQVWGVEIEEYAASIAKEKLDKVICDAFSSNLNLPSKSFDCIVFNDVLEHLVDPYSVLLYCKELLREQGVVIASIPNVRFFYNVRELLFYGNWEYTDTGILDKTHLRFFTYRSILSTFDRLGYDIETIEGINPLEKISLPGKFRYLNWLLWLFRNKIEDMRYLQFAVVARPRIS